MKAAIKFVSTTAATILFLLLWTSSVIVDVAGQSENDDVDTRAGYQNVIDALQSEFEGLRDCPIGVPDDVLNECIQLVLQDLKKFISLGVPSYGVPSGDPLRVSEITLGLPNQLLQLLPALRSSPVQLIWRNVEIIGLSNFTRGTARVDSKAKSLGLDLDYPELRVSAEYEVIGRLFGLGFRRQGRIIVRAANIRIDHKTFINFDSVTQTLQPRSVEAKASFGEIHVDMPELASSGPVGSAFVAFINRGLRLLKPLVDRYSSLFVPPFSLAVQKSPQYQPVLRALSYFFIPYLS